MPEAVGTRQVSSRCSDRLRGACGGLDRTLRASADSESHKAGALNKRNVVWLLLLFGRQSAPRGTTLEQHHAIPQHRRRRQQWRTSNSERRASQE
jgi:hypothetical protein